MGASAGGRMRSGARKLLNAARVGSRVNVEGVRGVTNEFDSLLKKLQQVRAELEGINKLQGGMSGSSVGASGPTGGMGGTGQGQSNPSLSRFSQMTTGFNMLTTGFALSKTASVIGGAVGGVSSRFNRNLAESIPISQGNMFIASQYSGANYSSMEWDRVKALGQFNMNRTDTLAAQSIGLSYGQSYKQANTFLSQTVAPLVQASGGTLAPSQAAAMGSVFLDPMVQRRASAMHIGLGKIGGQVQNPLTVAMGYITDFQKRNKVTMNEIDFQNLQSPGSSMRLTFKRLYGLSDDAVDTVVQAGRQNITFQGKYGASSTIDFSNTQNLADIGMSTGRLGMKAFQYMTAATSRETRFAATQSGAEVGKLNQDINIENTLSDVEDKFSALIGPLGEFQKYIKLATGALQAMGGLMMMKGLMGGGGLFGGSGGLGVGTGIAGAESSGAGYSMTGAAGGGTGLQVAGGVALAAGSNWLGGKLGGTGGGAVSIGGGALGGAIAGGAIGTAIMPGIGTAVGAAGGAVVGGAINAVTYFNSQGAKDVSKALPTALGMTDADLINGIKNVRNHESFGPKETARYDVWQMRRGALTAALIQRVRDETSAFKGISNDAAAEIAKEFDFFQSAAVTNDDKFNNKKDAFRKTVMPLIRKDPGAMNVYSQLFGAGVDDPFDWNHSVDTPEAKALIMTSDDFLGKQDSTGDPTGDSSAVRGAKGPTWTNLKPEMQQKLSALFAASGGRVWLGNGWRSEDQQKAMFLSRYQPDPNGDVTYQGKKWKRVSGAPAAPPGSSMHEIGLAADLEGDLNWVQANASQFGLKTFAGVNGEPWHVQPDELPNSRSEYEKTSGSSGGASSGTSAATGTTASLGDAGSYYSGGGGTASAISGVGFSINNAGPGAAITAASIMTSTASSTTMGSNTGASAGPAGTTLTAEQVAKTAYAAGFRGSALTEMVAIAMRESGGKTGARNDGTAAGGDGLGRDNSYGLWQINMKGDMGPARLKQFGLTSNDQLYDPATNARAAWITSGGGTNFSPWGIQGNPTAKTNMAGAAAAVSAAGYANSGDPMGGGGGNTTIHVAHVSLQVALQATGKLDYDSDMLISAAAAKLQDGMAMTARRSGQ